MAAKCPETAIGLNATGRVRGEEASPTLGFNLRLIISLPCRSKVSLRVDQILADPTSHFREAFSCILRNMSRLTHNFIRPFALPLLSCIHLTERKQTPCFDPPNVRKGRFPSKNRPSFLAFLPYAPHFPNSSLPPFCHNFSWGASGPMAWKTRSLEINSEPRHVK